MGWLVLCSPAGLVMNNVLNTGEAGEDDQGSHGNRLCQVTTCHVKKETTESSLPNPE